MLPLFQVRSFLEFKQLQKRFTLKHVCYMIKTNRQKLTSLLEIVEEKGTDTTLPFVLDDLQKQNLENLPPGGGIHSK